MNIRERRERIKGWLWRLVWWPQLSLSLIIWFASIGAIYFWLLQSSWYTDFVEQSNFGSEGFRMYLGIFFIILLTAITGNRLGKVLEISERATERWLENKLYERWGEGWDGGFSTPDARRDFWDKS